MLLGIDYGTKRIGFALADRETRLALPFGSIPNRGLVFVLKNLKEIIRKEKISLIVIGLPVSLSGKEETTALKVRKFAGKLKPCLKIPIIFEDERLTTALVESLMKGKLKKYDKDALSAMVILQSYLDKSIEQLDFA